MLVGVIWIAVMTWICYVGIEVSARTQWFLLGAELITLVIFAVVALGARLRRLVPRRRSPVSELAQSLLAELRRRSAPAS